MIAAQLQVAPLVSSEAAAHHRSVDVIRFHEAALTVETIFMQLLVVPDPGAMPTVRRALSQVTKRLELGGKAELRRCHVPRRSDVDKHGFLGARLFAALAAVLVASECTGAPSAQTDIASVFSAAFTGVHGPPTVVFISEGFVDDEEEEEEEAEEGDHCARRSHAALPLSLRSSRSVWRRSALQPSLIRETTAG